MNDFFTRIEELLKEQNKTQKDFAEAVGLSAPQAYITQKSRGTYPKADMATKMAMYLNTTVEYLVTGKETNEYKVKYDKLKSSVLDAVENN